jgi:hypothetical protein
MDRNLTKPPIPKACSSDASGRGRIEPSPFTAGFAIRADALRAVRGCGRAPGSVVLNGKRKERNSAVVESHPCCARMGHPRVVVGESGFTAKRWIEAKGELPVSPWNRARWQEGESGFTAKPCNIGRLHPEALKY